MPNANRVDQTPRLDELMGSRGTDHEADAMTTSPGGRRRHPAVAPPPTFNAATEDVRVRFQLRTMLASSARGDRLLRAVRTRAVEIADAWVYRGTSRDFPRFAPTWILQALAGVRIDALGDQPTPVEPKSVFDAVTKDLDGALAEASDVARRQLSVRIGELITANAVQFAAQQAERAIRGANDDEARRVFDAFDAALAGLPFGARHCLDATALARLGVDASRSGAMADGPAAGSAAA